MRSNGIRIALLAPLPPPTGGIGTWALRTKTSMTENCEIVLVDEGLIGGREFFGEKSKKKLIDEWKRCRRIWHNLDATLASGDVDIVHANIPAVPGGILRELVCAQIAHLHGCKFIIHWHSTLSQSVDSPVTEVLLKRLCDSADAIIVLNEKSRKYLTGRTNTRTYLLPNFVMEEELADSVNIKDKVCSCLYVGGVCEDKGIYDFLALSARFPNITFKAVGEIEEGVESAAPKNVVLTGPLNHDHVRTAMADSDVFLFLTHYQHEGFSVALTEAMAAGLPCIATDWAANADMLGTSGGVIVQPGDIDSAIHALSSMMSREVRETMALSNIAKVEANYTAKRVLGNLIGIYHDVLADGSKKGQ